ncbi:carbohydrate binding domain-containing protein [Cerasicoccus frondis]|uniref:carbohydrate binding domain-containing protein n=1 Tax=Cerasicoccus frondis TaxID=490090 RepID=UPI00285268E8|nr:carbohydrate binding domain-containing protein [Cerasicoccus frondis]
METAFGVEPNALFQDGFESGLCEWVLDEDETMSVVLADAAHRGASGLRVTDESEIHGSSISTPRFPVDPGLVYEVRFMARAVEKSRAAVYIRFFDEAGEQLNRGADLRAIVGSRQWRKQSVKAYPPEGAVAVDAWIHSYAQDRDVVFDIDDFTLVAYEPEAPTPPWVGTYKLEAGASDLTVADVVGPDGLVYPDWRMAGIAGGIPHLPTVVGPEFFEGSESGDIGPLINEALEIAAKTGGGAVELPAGVFSLESPIVIQHSGVVLRGNADGETRLLYQEHIPYGEMRSRNWSPSGILGPNSSFEIQTNPKNLVRISARSGDVSLFERQRAAHWGNRFSMRLTGRSILDTVGPGTHVVTAEIEYANGDCFSQDFSITATPEDQPGNLAVGQYGAIIAVGRGPIGPKVSLARSALRGSNQLSLGANHGLEVGDRIMILAPATERWNQITGNRCPWGVFRSNQFEITEIDGDVVTVNQAFRIEFPLEDGSYVQRIGVVDRFGVEDLVLEQKIFSPDTSGERDQASKWYAMEDLWANGVTFNYAWNGWIKNVKVVNSGRNPLYLTNSKFCEIRNSIADGAIFRGGGGSGYVGFEKSFDCLMDSVTTYTMRHAPNLQWGASGNVVRNGHFIGSDAQWHAGWTHENLFENNRIEQTPENIGDGTYGNAFYATGPSDAAHGPQGPRNVVYYNDVSAPKNGIVMLGGNEAWMVLYNRFNLLGNRALYIKEMSFDHIIAHNTFILPQGKSPAIWVGEANCTGIEIYDNIIYGPIKDIAGFSSPLGQFEHVEGNEILAIPTLGISSIPRPKPSVPSIFQWQRNHSQKISAITSP